MCNNTFDEDESYAKHLKSEHQVQKNFNEYLETAKRKAVSVKVKKEKEEVITVEDDGTEELPSTVRDKVLDEATKDLLRQSIDKLFQPMHDLLDGKLEIVEKGDDTSVNEDEIWKSFDDLKLSFQNIDISGDFLKSLIKPEKVSEEFRTPSLSRILPNSNQRKCLNPVKSGQSMMSGSSSRTSSSKNTFYLCPLPNCWFKVSKEQLKNSMVGANHLGKVHNVTGEMMRIEKERGNKELYKFRKINV